MIRRCHHHICMSLVSDVTPARSRPTFAICGVPSQVWQRERRRRRRRLVTSRRSASSLHLPPSSLSGQRMCRKHLSASGPTTEAHPLKDCRGPRGGEASKGGYIKANANLFGHHQRVTRRLLPAWESEGNPSTKSRETRALWVPKRGILSSFLFPPF